MLDAQTQRLDRAADKLLPGLRDLQASRTAPRSSRRARACTVRRTSPLGATPSRPCATPPPTPTALRPAPCGARAGAATSRRPASSLRQPSTPATSSAPARIARRWRTCRGHARRDYRRQGHREPGSGHRAPRQGPRQVCRHRPRARRRTRRREDRGELGRAQRRPPDRLQAGLGSPRTGRTLPPQRGTPQPPAEGRHRVPRQRHHREPRRSRKAARHPGSAAAGRTITGRVTPVARCFAFASRPPAHRSRALRAALVAASPRPPSVSLRSPPAQPFGLHVTYRCTTLRKVHRQPRAIRNRNPFPLHRLPRTAGRTTP